MQKLSCKFDKLEAIIKKTRDHRKEIAILIIANLKSSNKYKDDYKAHSLKTEFYAEEEFEQIVTAFRENDFYSILFNNEKDFFEWVLAGNYDKIDRKFIAVYNAATGGKGPGKKALIPSFCNFENIAITSSNPYVVSLCRHKYHFSKILDGHSIHAAKSWLYDNKFKWLLNERPPEGKTVIAKLTYEAASIGTDNNSVFNYETKYDAKLNALSLTYNQPITIQEFISGYEVEIPIIIQGGIPLAIKPIGLSLNNKGFLGSKILTYDIVYNDHYNFYEFIEFGDSFNEELLTVACNAAAIMGIEGFGRVDFRINENREFHIIDISTYPHIIQHSSFWYLFNNLGFMYKDLFTLLVGLTAERNAWY